MVTWTHPLPVWPLGGAKFFFSNSIFSATVRAISEFFSGSYVPRGALLKFRGHEAGGQIWGRGPQSENLWFLLSHNSQTLKVKMAPAVDRDGDPLSSLKFWIYVVERFLEKMRSENVGGVALFRYHPLGGLPSLIWPLEIVVLGTLAKIVFVRGIAPHLGEIWILVSLHFGPLFLELRIQDFWNFKPIVSRYRLLSIPRIEKKSVFHDLSKCRSNFGKKCDKSLFGVAKGENILSPTAVTMG